MRKRKRGSSEAVSALLEGLGDGHVHVGPFVDGRLFSPAYVCRQLSRLRLRRWVLSSLSGGSGQSVLAELELRECLSLAPGRGLALLWGTPEMSEEVLRRLASSGFYGGLKIHPQLSQWDPRDARLERLFELARELSWPVLVHTGWTPESEAERFLPLYRRFPDVTVVLAHARPINQTVRVLRCCERAFADTAYVSLESLRGLLRCVGAERIVLGSDFPVDLHFFPRASVIGRYRRRVQRLAQSFGESHLRRWGGENLDRAYGPA